MNASIPCFNTIMVRLQPTVIQETSLFQNINNTIMVRLQLKEYVAEKICRICQQYHNGSIATNARWSPRIAGMIATQYHNGSIATNWAVIPSSQSLRDQYHNGSIATNQRENVGMIRLLSPIFAVDLQ